MSDDQIPAVHRHVSEQASPCPSAPLNHHTIETFDRHECERHSSQDTTTISATNQDAPSDCDTQTEALSSFDSLNEASIKEPQVDTLPKTVEASQVTSQEDLGTSAPCTEETATTEELLHTSLKENTEKKINTTSECQKQEGQVSEPDSEKVSSVDDTDKFDLTEPKITTMNNEGIINPAFTLQEETHINASQCDSQTDELLSLDNTQDTDIAPDTNHSVCSHSSNTEPLVINEDETSIDDQMMAQNSQTYLLESDNPFQSSSPFMEESKACSSSATNINFTPLDRQLYERLEDPATCSKYYQICTDEDDTLEDEVKFKPTETSTENSSVAILPAGEIVVHEAADSASECGSEDVEMIGHRYETANERQYKTNTISLAAELLGTNQQLPYDKEFKPLAQEGPFNVCYTNTHVLEGFYGRLNRQGRGWRRDVADSGIHTDESGDETEQRRRSQGLEDDEVSKHTLCK